MKLKSIQTLTFVIISIALIGCTKEGCTDSNAENFDSEATENDDSCEYNSAHIGTYTSNRSCNYSSDSTFDISVIEGPNTNEIVLNNIMGDGANIRATMNGQEFSFNEEFGPGTYHGTGYFLENSITITVNLCETIYYPCDDEETCQVYGSK